MPVQLIASVEDASSLDVQDLKSAGFNGVDVTAPVKSISGLEGFEVYANVSPSVLATQPPETEGTAVYDVKLYSAMNYLDTMWKLQAKAPIAVRDMDTAHLRLLTGSGYRISALKVRMSVVDRRCEENGLLAWCRENGVKVLAYDTGFGGFLDSAQKPDNDGVNGVHAEFVESAGGWDKVRSAVDALKSLAQKHSVAVSALSAAYVASLGVDGLIVPPDAKAPVALSAADVSAIRDAVSGLTTPKGCPGDEAKYPASLTSVPGEEAFNAFRLRRMGEIERVLGAGGRVEAASGAKWEPIAAYARGVRVGAVFEIAGTTARAHPSGKGCLGRDAEDQATNILDIVAAAVHAVGADMRDITRTRVLLKDVKDWPGQCKVHGAVMGRHGIRPADTMVGGTVPIIEGSLVEIEAQGVVGGREGPRLRAECHPEAEGVAEGVSARRQ